MPRLTLSALALSALAACSGPTNLLELPPETSTLRLRASVSSAMVRTVSLPSYAAAEEYAVESAPGVIEATSDLLWADAPDRAATLAVAGHLTDILGITVGPEPWPFVGLPDVSVDIRVARMLAGADGVFRLTGQYFVGGDGIDYPNSTRSFAYAVPLVAPGTEADVTAGGVAAAQGRALRLLAEDIARGLGR